MQKIDYPKLFETFEEREPELRRVTRYHIYQPMFYRSNLFTHSKRVLWLLQSFLPLVEEVFGTEFDTTKAQLMAVVHDDAEIVMGDIMAGHKLKMNAEQLAEVARQEQNAVEQMAERYPKKILGYDYGDLLREEQKRESLEAKLLKYADRFDAYGEALNEVFAGNRKFMTNTVHELYGKVSHPIEYYQEYFPDFAKNNPEFNALFLRTHPIFNVPLIDGLENIVGNGKPHTEETIKLKTGYAPYEFWKNIIFESNDQEEIQNLYIQKEFA